jgi:murein DD-endopeptidase MepM/ murein hydrolase activator NlpD
MPISDELKQSNTITKPIGWFFPTIFALVVATIINKVAIYWLDFKWTTLLDIVNYFGVYFLISWFVRKYNSAHNTKDQDKEKHPAYDWPMPAPIVSFGKFAPIFTYYPSVLLSLLNPFLLYQQIRQLLGQGITNSRIKRNPAHFADFQSKTQYRLPFNSEWLIYHGGHTPATSHSWNVLTQRYAYDFVMADEKFSRHQSKGGNVKDYYCYGQDIVAAANGEVVKVVDGLADGFGVGYFIVDFSAREMAGNHIIIKHADGEYGFYAHLVRNSIKPKVGDKVIQGQTIALCGFSGNSTEPHLHFHLQDTASFYHSVGLPIKFTDVCINGELVKNECIIERGSRVQHKKVKITF